MKKNIYFSFCFFLFVSFLYSAEEIPQAITQLDDLIQATHQSLNSQKELRVLILKYEEAQKKCIENPNDNELLYQAAIAGHRVLDKIKEAYLIHNFSEEFIKELTLFDQVGSKNLIPSP